MLKKSLRWLALAIAVLFMIDMALPLLDSWRGTQDQWLAAVVLSVFAVLTVTTVLMKAAVNFLLRRLGSGDIDRGRQLLDAHVAARKNRRGVKGPSSPTP